MCASQLFLKLFFGFKSAKPAVKMSPVLTPWGAAMKLTLTWGKLGSSCSCEELGAYPQQQQCWVEVQPWAWGAQRQSPAVPRGVSICRKEWSGGGRGGGEGLCGSQQKLTSHKLFPLQPISGHSLLTYVFPFTLQYVCQRAIAPLTPALLFVPSLFAHFNPVPFITAHPSPSLPSTSDSYFLICLGFSPFGFFLHFLPPSEFPTICPLHLTVLSHLSPHSFSCSFFLCSQWTKGHSHMEKDAFSGVIPLSLVPFHHIWSSRSLEFPFCSFNVLFCFGNSQMYSRSSQR